jgi:carbamoylphosphate synthase small subunit
MLNHIPVLGIAFGLALVSLALLRKSEELKRISLGS